jgi:hypothetical protein
MIAVYRSVSGRVRRYPLRDGEHAPRIMQSPFGEVIR